MTGWRPSVWRPSVWRLRWRRWAGTGVLLALGLTSLGAMTACRSSIDHQDLSLIYNRSAAFQYPDRRPVIVIPGLIGSRLVEQETGRMVWGTFGGDEFVHPKTAEGARLIALPLRQGEAAPKVEPQGVLDRIVVKLVGLPLQLKAYFHILMTLGVGGYRDEAMGESGAIDYGPDHYTCFQFDYDWRLDISANAERLHRFILEKREYVASQTLDRYGIEPKDTRFDFVAHSMGGLLARYYLRYGGNPLPSDGSEPELTWEGARYVERAILVATPNAGTFKAFEQLVEGIRHAPGLPRYPAAILGTFPAGYQMLPRPRHGSVVYHGDPRRRANVLDPSYWIENRLGLANPEQEEVLQQLLPDVESAHERRRIALNYLRAMLRQAERFQAALDIPSPPPPGTELYLITGDSEKTGSVMTVNDKGQVKLLEYGAGDGSVLRTSALMDERVGGFWQPQLRSPIAWRNVMFIPGRHFRITKNPQFANNLLYRLLEQPRRDL